MDIKYHYDKDGLIHFVEQHSEDSQTNGFIRDPEKAQELIDSGVEIAPYVEPVKSLEELQQEALAAINEIVLAECRKHSGTKLYFHDLTSASRYAHSRYEALKPEQYARAIQLLDWDVAIDEYCEAELFKIAQGSTPPDLQVFLSNLPSIGA